MPTKQTHKQTQPSTLIVALRLYHPGGKRMKMQTRRVELRLRHCVTECRSWEKEDKPTGNRNGRGREKKG